MSKKTKKEVAEKMIDYEAGRKKILAGFGKKALARRNAVPEQQQDFRHGKSGYPKSGSKHDEMLKKHPALKNPHGGNYPTGYTPD